MAQEKECIFCKIGKKEQKIEVIYESKNFIAVPDINPRTKGHTLIMPKKHYVTLIDLPESLGGELLDTIKKVFEIRSRDGAQGFNIIVNNFPVAGQYVMHSHLHLLPRKKGDGFQVIG